jgi:hypothetical protein
MALIVLIPSKHQTLLYEESNSCQIYSQSLETSTVPYIKNRFLRILIGVDCVREDKNEPHLERGF